MLIAVSIYFWGNKLDPQRVTEILGLVPQTARAKGEIRTLPSNKVVTTKTGVWSYSTDAELKSSVLSEHLELLWTRFGSNVGKFGSLSDIEDACVDVFMAINVEEDGTEANFELSPKDLSDLRQFELPVRFTIAFTGTEEAMSDK